MSLPATPHDALFRALLCEPRRVVSLPAEYLPQEVTALIDPEAVEGRFIDEDAARMLFRARPRSGHDARLSVLLERKSRVDADTVLQVLRRRGTENGAAGNRLPTVVPLVFYHGRDRWRVPRSAPDMTERLQSLNRDLTMTLDGGMISETPALETGP